MTDSLSGYSPTLYERTNVWLQRRTGLSITRQPSYPAHITARELRKLLGAPVFDSYYSFAFSRNPWAWQVSLYTFMRKNKNHWQHDLALKFKSFDDYCRWRCDGNFDTQKDFVCSETGELLVDFVGKTENIDNDFHKICQTIGLPRISLERKNVSNTIPYSQFYSDFSRDLIQRTFAEDISFFEYSYG